MSPATRHERATEGIVSLRDAIIGVPGFGSRLLFDGGPFLSTTEEAVLLVALLLFCVALETPSTTFDGRR